MFSANTDDIQFLFESAGQPVLINDIEHQAIITNPQMSTNEERYIHTLDGVPQGDIVTIDDKKFLAISESTIKRHGKYKNKIRHCNYVIEIAGEIREELLRDEEGNILYDKYGRPIYIEVKGDPIQIPMVVDYKSFSVIAGQITVAENQIFVTVQENEINRGRFKVNNTFELMDLKWKVRNVDKTKRGLLLLTCEKVI